MDISKRKFEMAPTTDYDSEPAAPPKKKICGNYSKTSKKIMENMGFKSDTGLGKYGQGLLEPIQPASQNGRRGLGLNLDGINNAAVNWSPDMENIQLRETINWIENYSDDLNMLLVDELKQWIVKGPKKLTIDDEYHFCDPVILKNVVANKSIFDNMGANEMSNARSRSNPFEAIGKGIFLNRAAMKMANMDAALDFMFTNPVDENGGSLLNDNELLSFADVCAGPGGFSEYVLWRKKWESKGIGFTLRQDNDFKLDQFLAGHPETFDTYYGLKGDGDIYNPENIASFQDYVLKQTGSGVHFMMSDGGFDVQGNENVQEILSKRLYLCQCLTALSIVRENGHFVTKLFDTFTPFSVGLIYLMYSCFKQICIVKPNTSRPANSERYLVCKWKKSDTEDIRNYMFDMNLFFHKNVHNNIDINEIVPMDVLKSDEQFFNYIYECNNTIGHNQIVGLLKIAHYCKNPRLRESRQQEIKAESLRMWRVPNEMRMRNPTKLPAEQLFKTLMDNNNSNWYPEKEFFKSFERCLTPKTRFNDVFFDRSDWAFVPIDVVENAGKSIRTFFMSRGNCDVYKYTESKTWVPLDEITVEISPNTLFYGEIVKELTGEGSAQRMSYSLHMIDGIVLGGIDIRNYKLSVRNRICQKFAAALNKPQKQIETNKQQTLTASIRCKPLYQLNDLRGFFDSMREYRLKDKKMRLGLSVRDILNPDRFYVPRGLMLFKILKPNLCKRFDKNLQDFFYTDIPSRKNFLLSEIPDPNSIYGSFKSTFPHRKLWKWDDPLQVKEIISNDVRRDDLLYRLDFERFLYNGIVH